MTLKLVAVGDGGVGKSCVYITYATNTYPADYVPTVFDNYTTRVFMDGKPYDVALWDTAGQEDYDRLRPLCYPQTDVFIVCFSIDNQGSFCNVEERWLPELKHYCPDTAVILVGCKSDLRTSPPSKQHVSEKAIQSLASSHGLTYVETSSLQKIGLQELFKEVVKAAIYNVPCQKKRKFPRLGFGRHKNDQPQLPEMPPAGKAPTIEIETSTFSMDWLKFLGNPKHSDVTFHLRNDIQLKANSIMLASSSEFFRLILGFADIGMENNQLEKLKTKYQLSMEAVNNGKVSGLEKVTRATIEGEMSITVTVSDEVDPMLFVHVLEFLYSGLPDIKGKGLKDDDVKKLKELADWFELKYLHTFCQNLGGDNEIFNPSIGTFLNDETGKRMKELFFNKPDVADVVFNVNGTKIYAHKSVLAARSEVLSAMFSGSFQEGNDFSNEITIPGVSEDCLLALLEYLYTDHSPIEDSDSVGMMLLADQYFAPRLVSLCELYITKEVERAVTKNIQKADIDVIGLMWTAENVNALQLKEWCLHFISTNYLAFKERPEFPLLHGESLEFVEEHRWPPVSYLNEIENYEKLMEKRGEKCVVM